MENALRHTKNFTRLNTLGLVSSMQEYEKIFLQNDLYIIYIRCTSNRPNLVKPYITIPIFNKDKTIYAKIDLEDYKRVKEYKWYLVMGYAHNSKDYMHRFIMNAKDDEKYDHIDRDKLNNRKENLRLANQKINMHNRSPKNGSQYKGVVRRGEDSYKAMIMVDSINYSLGTYETAKQAAIAYNLAVNKFYKDVGYLNVI